MRTGPVWMIARREIKTRMLTKANIISMAVMLAIIVIGAFVGNYFLDRDTTAPERSVALEQSVSDLRPQLELAAEQQKIELHVSTMTADDATAALVSAGDDAIDAFLSGDPASPKMLVAEQPDADVLALVGAAVRSYVITDQISGLGGDPGAFEEMMAAAAPTVETLQPASQSGNEGPAFGMAMVMISLLFGALISSGSIIAMGVVEEKTSRVVEILLATIKPTQLLAGKVLGIGVYGLFQIALLAGALAGALAALGLTADIEVNIGASLALLIVWFLLGYALFALLFGPFYTTMFMVPADPDSTVVRVLSQIPFFAPFMMPARDAFGAVAGWELALSMGIALVTIPLLVWVAARVYQRGVLHTGGRMKLAEALKG